jgi:menaquinone-dependent protoporphyrinogen IX oxidase
MQKYKDFNWIKVVLASCVNYQQWHNAEKLEQLFYLKYPEERLLFTELAYFSIETLYKIQDEK